MQKIFCGLYRILLLGRCMLRGRAAAEKKTVPVGGPVLVMVRALMGVQDKFCGQPHCAHSPKGAALCSRPHGSFALLRYSLILSLMVREGTVRGILCGVDKLDKPGLWCMPQNCCCLAAMPHIFADKFLAVLW